MGTKSDKKGVTSAGSSHKERDFRWQRVRKFMEERGLDGLLAFGSERSGADHYLTNDRPDQHVIFPRNGKIVSLAWSTQVVAQNFISLERGEDSWLEDIRVRWTGVTLVDLLREKGLENKRVGTVGLGASGNFPRASDGWVPYRMWQSIKEALPQTDFQDVTSDFLILMLERTPFDIDCLRRATAAGEEACRAIMEATRAGATELDVYAAGMSSFYKSGVDPIGMILTSGHDNFCWGRPAWLSRAQPPRVLEEGDIVMGELFPRYGGMEAQLQLAVGIGKIHPDHEACGKAARKAYEAGLAMIRPGVAFSEVCEAMERPVREIGGWHLTPMVHTLNPLTHTSSIALGIEKQVPEIADRYVKVRGRDRARGDDLELKPGMTFAFEPNAHLGRHRVNIGGTVVVTEKGAEELNDIPNRLQRVPGKK